MLKPSTRSFLRAFLTASKPPNGPILSSKKPQTTAKKNGVAKAAPEEDIKHKEIRANPRFLLPQAPKLKSFAPRELRLQALYSGYRPVFMEYRQSRKEPVIPEPTFWAYSATEEAYDEAWEGVPNEISERLRMFDDGKSVKAAPVQKKGAVVTGGRRGRKGDRLKNRERILELRRLLKK